MERLQLKDYRIKINGEYYVVSVNSLKHNSAVSVEKAANHISCDLEELEVTEVVETYNRRGWATQLFEVDSLDYMYIFFNKLFLSAGTGRIKVENKYSLGLQGLLGGRQELNNEFSSYILTTSLFGISNLEFVVENGNKGVALLSNQTEADFYFTPNVTQLGYHSIVVNNEYVTTKTSVKLHFEAKPEYIDLSPFYNVLAANFSMTCYLNKGIDEGMFIRLHEINIGRMNIVMRLEYWYQLQDVLRVLLTDNMYALSIRDSIHAGSYAIVWYLLLENNETVCISKIYGKWCDFVNTDKSLSYEDFESLLLSNT